MGANRKQIKLTAMCGRVTTNEIYVIRNLAHLANTLVFSGLVLITWVGGGSKIVIGEPNVLDGPLSVGKKRSDRDNQLILLLRIFYFGQLQRWLHSDQFKGIAGPWPRYALFECHLLVNTWYLVTVTAVITWKSSLIWALEEHWLNKHYQSDI